jgi:murein DD-endopeptidase MepM/ murein hydrolase activator NlpD
MGRGWVRATCALLVGLWLCGTASAHTDAGRQLEFEWPAAGVVSSPFGPRVGGFHPGLDIGTLRSLTVRSASAGVVRRTGAVTGYSGYGNVVVVDVGDGFTELYAHLAHPWASRGQHLVPGQRVGLAGCTGWCTGTHLHFELRYHGRPLDPLPLFTTRLQ